MSTIKVKYKDHRVFEANKVYAISWMGGELIILLEGIFGGRDSKVIDDSEIESVEFSIGDN